MPASEVQIGLAGEYLQGLTGQLLGIPYLSMDLDVTAINTPCNIVANRTEAIEERISRSFNLTTAMKLAFLNSKEVGTLMSPASTVHTIQTPHQDTTQ
jgi:hypothetical protein